LISVMKLKRSIGKAHFTKPRLLLLAVVITGLAIGRIFCPEAARADDDRCRVPPYGMTEPEFKAFVEGFGHIVSPAKTLPIICNMKYSGADRTALYNLGFTDRDIESKKVGDIAIGAIMALHNIATKSK
jgi:hypothetical protein